MRRLFELLDEVVETFKRFLMRKKTTTPKPSSDAITGLILTSPRSRVLTNSTSSVFGDSFRRKSSSTSRYAGSSYHQFEFIDIDVSFHRTFQYFKI